MWERIPAEAWRSQTGHVERYQLAAGLLLTGEIVLDAACGVGYGATVLREAGWAGEYHAADLPGVHDLMFPGTIHEVDLNTWQPDFEFDVALCFETLEHLADPAAWAAQANRAKRLVLVSVPTVPTKHFNPWHLHDFTVDDIPALFPGRDCIDVIPQPAELSHIFVFR